MTHRTLPTLLLAIALIAAGVAAAAWPFSETPAAGDETLVGAWRGKVQFTSGPFASVKDLEFMYAFNQGGTMTESSNYDGAPPVPPAYGVWRKVKPWQYEARYSFFLTKPPQAFEDLAKGGGWAPAATACSPNRSRWRRTASRSAPRSNSTSTTRPAISPTAAARPRSRQADRVLIPRHSFSTG